MNEPLRFPPDMSKDAINLLEQLIERDVDKRAKDPKKNHETSIFCANKLGRIV